MFDRFTDRSRTIMTLANQASLRQGHDTIGAEAVLLGILEEGSGVAAHTLRTLGVDLNALRVEVEHAVTAQSPTVTGKLAPNHDTQKIIEHAIQESLQRGDNYVGTEHLLLGLLRKDRPAARLLIARGVTLESARETVANILSTSPKPEERAAPRVPQAGGVDLSIMIRVVIPTAIVITTAVVLWWFLR